MTKKSMFKLFQNSVSGDLFNTLARFLSNSKQRVVLKGQISTWENVSVGVRQGSVLGPPLFLIYV